MRLARPMTCLTVEEDLLRLANLRVPRVGIEPTTRGFSVRVGDLYSMMVMVVGCSGCAEAQGCGARTLLHDHSTDTDPRVLDEDGEA